MLWILNDVLGKGLLVVVIGAVIIFGLSGFWDFGDAWHQYEKDVEEHERQSEERPVIGFIDGKAYDNEEEFAQDYQDIMSSSWSD